MIQGDTQKPLHSIFYKPIFWILFSYASLGAALASYFYSPYAFIFLDVTVTVNREEALQKATQLATLYNLGPNNPSCVASFTSDEYVQGYVELEYGSAAFQALIKKNIYQPYLWKIRCFKEKIHNEVTLTLTPTGKPYSFQEDISEDDPGSTLSEEEAQALAQEFLKDTWGLSLENYLLIQSAREEQANTRTDYRFIYEYQDELIVNAPYRISVVVTGNKITEITPFIHVPESFSRKYSEMRSFNSAFGNIATMFLYVVYIFSGCFIGALFLLKYNALLVSPALKWALFMSCAQALSFMNQSDSLWFSYDTALSSSGFIFQFVLQTLTMLLFWTLLYTITFSVAEGLTRKAFGNHIQFFKVWSMPLAHSYQVWGQTLFAYLFVSFEFLYIVLFYSISMHWFGCWIPSSTLINPNILSSYFPWFEILSSAFSAGFWEECLFRAIPLAGAVLIGKRVGYPKIFLTLGFILQILIFGGAHAYYPTQPYYIRLIELAVPSTIWALIYLRLGLLPSIIMHSMYDAILFALPLFNAQSMIFNKFMVIIGMLMPIFIIAFKTLKSRNIINAPLSIYNKAWKPIPKKIYLLHSDSPKYKKIYNLNKFTLSGIILSMIVGTLLWLKFEPFKTSFDPATITKAQAIQLAYKALEHENIVLDSCWKALPYLYPDSNSDNYAEIQEQEDYVIDTTKDLRDMSLKKLLGSYIPYTHWIVRYALFKGSNIDNTEEYSIKIINPETIIIDHILPESSLGEKLAEDQARILALNYIQDHYKLDLSMLSEISTESIAQINRTDWTFKFNDIKNYTLSKGKALIIIYIAGNKVTKIKRFIAIPEEWLREYRSKKQLLNTLNYISFFTICFIIILSCFKGLQYLLAGYFNRKKVYWITFLYSILFSIKYILDLPIAVADFTTIEPLLFQSLSFALNFIPTLIITIVWVSLITTYIYSFPLSRFKLKNNHLIFIAIALGIFFTGLRAFIQYYIVPPTITRPITLGIRAYIPLLSFILSFVSAYFKQTLYLLFLSIISPFNRLYRVILSAFFISTLLIPPIPTYSITLPLWSLVITIYALAIIFVYRFIIRYDSTIIPLITSVPFLASLIPLYISPPYPLTNYYALATFIILIFISYIWFLSLRSDQKP